MRRLFERAHYTVVRNPGAALPRQTDLYARRGDEEFLIEVKWRKRPADSGDYDGLLARLRRAPGRVVGIFFSMAGFTKEVVQELEHDHTREVLLFTGEEIRRLFAGEAALRVLIRRKRRQLVIHGRVYLDVGTGLWDGEPLPDRALLPVPDAAIWSPDGGVCPWAAGKGDFGALVSIQAWPEVDVLIPSLGGPVSFDLPLPIATRPDFAHILDALRRWVGVSPQGRFSIQQSGVVWQGLGAANFLGALDRWEERYAEVRTKFHHSEEVTYFDHCDGGFYTLTGQVQGAKEGLVSYPQLSVQLAGVPADPTHWRELAQAFDLEDFAYFRPLAEPTRRGDLHWAGEPVRLEASYFLKSGGWISGIIAKNPFSDTDYQDNAATPDDRLPRALRRLELVVCALASHHRVNERAANYFLSGLWWTRTAWASIAYVQADWDAVHKGT